MFQSLVNYLVSAHPEYLKCDLFSAFLVFYLFCTFYFVSFLFTPHSLFFFSTLAMQFAWSVAHFSRVRQIVAIIFYYLNQTLTLGPA